MPSFTLDVEPANEVWLDIFPAKVYDESGEFVPVHEEFRVIVTDNRFYLIDDTIDGPKVIISEGLVAYEGSVQTGYYATTDHRRFHVQRAQNCGCGSRIRGLHPFAGVPQARPR